MKDVMVGGPVSCVRCAAYRMCCAFHGSGLNSVTHCFHPWVTTLKMDEMGNIITTSGAQESVEVGIYTSH
jgi:hypothetical protein